MGQNDPNTTQGLNIIKACTAILGRETNGFGHIEMSQSAKAHSQSHSIHTVFKASIPLLFAVIVASLGAMCLQNDTKCCLTKF